jgi:hypothetical protein
MKWATFSVKEVELPATSAARAADIGTQAPSSHRNAPLQSASAAQGRKHTPAGLWAAFAQVIPNAVELGRAHVSVVVSPGHGVESSQRSVQIPHTQGPEAHWSSRVHPPIQFVSLPTLGAVMPLHAPLATNTSAAARARVLAPKDFILRLHPARAR